MIGLHTAREIADEAFAEATRRGIDNITVLVADPGGAVRLALRNDAQGAFGFDTARAKAQTALGFGKSSKRLAEIFGDDPAATVGINAAVGGCFMPIAGAVVVHDAAGTVVGAVSVSGGNPLADDEVARVAVDRVGLFSSP